MANSRPVRVLVVDDHASVREGLRAALGTWPDVEVVGEASDGLAALAEFWLCRPDVVLLDLRMPGMGGLETLGALRRADPTARVLVLTAHDSPEHAQEAAALGAAGFLQKALPAAEIAEALLRVAAGGRVFPAGL
jgi:DNA-binding NarL/FixJ family response regulator